MDTTDRAWCNLNPIRAKAALDHVPRQSGLYKLTFKLWGTTYAYIGQAGNLWRRIGEYAHNPTRGNHIEYLMLDLLTAAGEAELSICCLGLESEKDRRGFEKTAITEARQQGLTCLNKGESTDIRMQRFRLESEQRMLIKDLARVRAKLAKL
jgi:hypothetical protein